jgi:cryptochrome
LIDDFQNQANYPAKFIYEPWKAPLSVQQQSGCIIGNGPNCGYPAPIVDHDIVSAENMGKMKEAYAAQRDAGEEEDGEGGGGKAAYRQAKGASSSSSSSSGSKRKTPETASSPASSSMDSFVQKKPKSKGK